MNTIYFIIYESRAEHVWSYPYTWKSLIANVNLEHTKVVVTNYSSRPEIMSNVPSSFEIRNIGGFPSVPVWPGIRADYVKWETSKEGDPNDHILFLDARDIIFQRDPFMDIDHLNVAASCEGVTHERCSWNLWDHNSVRQYFPGELWPNIGLWPVVNFGVVGGKRSHVRWAMLLTWMVGCRFNSGGSDQGIWNMTWNHYLKDEPGYWLCQPELHDWCVVGDHSAHIKPAPYWENGTIFCPTTRRPYAIVHQWERSDCLWPRDILIQRWN